MVIKMAHEREGGVGVGGGGARERERETPTPSLPPSLPPSLSSTGKSGDGDQDKTYDVICILLKSSTRSKWPLRSTWKARPQGLGFRV